MKKYVPFSLLALVFFLLKITNWGVFLSDTNIYFYTAYQLFHGQLLYRDIFFTNLPVFPYIAAVYIFLTRGNVSFFYFTASIEVMIVSFLIYYLVFQKTKSLLVATLSCAIYLFSFLILATSNHQTGVFLASLLAVLSYFFYTKKKYILQGVFLGLTILTKAYFLPIALAFFFVLLLKERKNLLAFLLGFSICLLIVLLPFLIFAPHDLYRDIISYSLTRSQGVSKMNIAWFFISHDLLFFLLLLFNIARIKKQLFFGLCSIFSLLFFLLYKDIYYLYLNFLIPFLCLSFSDFYLWNKYTFRTQKFFLPSILILFLCYNLYLYMTSFLSLQKIPNVSSIVSLIKKEHPPVLYGVNDTTPLLAYLSDTPLLGNIVDTNENIFRKGFLNKTALTKKAIAQHAFIIAHGAYYPEFHLANDLVGGIFDEKLVQKNCRLLKRFPVKTEGIENRITIFSCR